MADGDAGEHKRHVVVVPGEGRFRPRPVAEQAVKSIDARHKRTWPNRPQTNGKAERFIKTLLAEWAYGRLYRTNAERINDLPQWFAYYNGERTHTALRNITPMAALVNPPWESHLFRGDEVADTPEPGVGFSFSEQPCTTGGMRRPRPCGSSAARGQSAAVRGSPG